MSQNLTAKIKNPLAEIPKAQLIRDVEQFAEKSGLTEYTNLLIKGGQSSFQNQEHRDTNVPSALVAKNPIEFESVEGIDEVETEAIRNEVLHKWKQPNALYYTIILWSIGAAVQ